MVKIATIYPTSQ